MNGHSVYLWSTEICYNKIYIIYTEDKCMNLYGLYGYGLVFDTVSHILLTKWIAA